jgi:hypothetical protein
MSPLRYRNPMHGFQIFVHRMVKTSNSSAGTVRVNAPNTLTSRIITEFCRWGRADRTDSSAVRPAFEGRCRNP